MDKPLTDKGKKADSPEKDKEAVASPAVGGAVPAPEISAQPAPSAAESQNQTVSPSAPATDKTLGAYGEHTTRPLITKEAWNEIDKNKPWADDPKTRLAIRMFSRGVLGAAFFAGGGLLAKKWMGRKDLSYKGYNASGSFSEAASNNPLQLISKLIDTVVGKPIHATVKAITGSEVAAANAVTFRPTEYQRRGYDGKLAWGRTLGEETTMITFDFFCASIGDALGRDIAGWFDPSVKKTWMDDNGHIQIPKAIDAALKATTRYVTYNGGEDWAVAIPYAYFMKGQRALINKASPGFKYDFDRSINGGSFKLKDNKIVGNYNMEGLMDLQSRFTVYNVGTLMFREAYDYIGNKLSGKQDNLYGAPDKESHKGVVDKAGDLLKWVARSAVKGVIVMTPAVPFFWITRTPQTKHRSIFIDPEREAMLSNLSNPQKNKRNAVYAYNLANEKVNTGSNLTYSTYDPSFNQVNGAPFSRTPVDGHKIEPLIQGKSFNPYQKTFGVADGILNAAGSANNKIANAGNELALKLDQNVVAAKFNKTLGIENLSKFSRPFINASISYTPYMYAKAEFANMWDNGKMDMAAERMIDGAAKLNWGEFKSGAGEVWQSILRQPLKDAAREAEGQRRNKIDTSAADVFTKTQAQMQEEILQAQQEADKEKMEQEGKAASGDLSWQERIISTKPAPKKAEPAEKITSKKNYADQEAMRKVLEEHNPPTNSIN